MTVVEHIEKVIQDLKIEIGHSKGYGKGNRDGYTLQGLENKLQILEECLVKLKKKSYL